MSAAALAWDWVMKTDSLSPYRLSSRTTWMPGLAALNVRWNSSSDLTQGFSPQCHDWNRIFVWASADPAERRTIPPARTAPAARAHRRLAPSNPWFVSGPP